MNLRPVPPRPIRISQAGPCPATTTAVLGFPAPTRIPCGLLSGHDGPHAYRIEWTGR